jgi:hypothetical protein
MGSVLSWSALLAWLVASVCTAFGWRRRRSIEQLCPADSQQLLAELSGEVGNPEELDAGARSLAIAELNLRLADIAFALDVLPATFVALMRISLASGVGLALVSALSAADGSPILRAIRVGAAASGGCAGALAVAGFGRAARARAVQIRQLWDSSSRVIGKALGTQLAGTAGSSRIHGSSFPE